MTWNSPRASPARGRLARHLGRLQRSLDAVGEQVRRAVAHAVGRALAEAAGEAAYDALLPYAGPPGSLLSSFTGYSGRSPVSRPEWDDPSWGRESDASPWPDPYGYDGYDDLQPEDRRTPGGESHASRRARAVAAGLHAAAWWLRRHRGQVSLVAALFVGAIVGQAALTGHGSGIAGLVASALGMAYLLELVRSATTLLGRSNTP